MNFRIYFDMIKKSINVEAIRLPRNLSVGTSGHDLNVCQIFDYDQMRRLRKIYRFYWNQSPQYAGSLRIIASNLVQKFYDAIPLKLVSY